MSTINVTITLRKMSPRVMAISESLNALLQQSRCILHYGLCKKELEVIVDPLLQEDTIALSPKVFNQYTLPETLLFEMNVNQLNVYLGPVIGFVPVGRTERLDEENLEKFKVYASCYQRLNGLLYLFAANSIDFEKEGVEGFYYEPSEDRWKKGFFPFPNAIYRKTGFTQAIYDKLINIIGDKMFNQYFFDKLELWELLSKDERLKAYLPYTEKLQSVDQLKRFVDQYDEVYLKKEAGYKAKGILKVYKSEAGYHFVYRLRAEKIVKEDQEIELFLQELNIKKDYLIQQAILLKRYDGRNFDFRVILQKDHTKEWVCPGIIGKFGKKDSIATNFLLDGFSLNGVDSLKRAFNLSEKEAFVKEQEIIRVCKEACDALNEKIGHYADLGIDVMVDQHLKVWILEINKLHDHKFPLYGLNDPQMYYQVVSNPLLYAKAISKF